MQISNHRFRVRLYTLAAQAAFMIGILNIRPLPSAGAPAMASQSVQSCGLLQGQLVATVSGPAAETTLVFTLLAKNGSILARQWTSEKSKRTSVPLMWSTIPFVQRVAGVKCDVYPAGSDRLPLRDCADSTWLHVDEGPSIDSLRVMWNSTWLVLWAKISYRNYISNKSIKAAGSIVGFKVDDKPPVWVPVGLDGIAMAAEFGLSVSEHAVTVGVRDVGDPTERAVLLPVDRICLAR